MLKSQMIGILLVAGLLSCQKKSSPGFGGNGPNVETDTKDEGSKSGGTDDGNEMAIVNLTGDLGACNTSRRGKSYYVLAEKKFRYCADTDQWDVIDMKGADGSAGKNSLVSVTPEAAGINCAGGGQKIQNGLDQNANAQLDSSEVNSTSFACHGLVGGASLVSVTAESAGANCTAGGKKIQIGLDDNKDGTLEVSEAHSTQYVCNGSNGFSGFSSLSTANTEPPGSNCSYGGIRINIGLDNGDGGGIARDGLLQSGEVDSTSYHCQDVIPKRTVRITEGKVASNSTNADKDASCNAEFGGNYVGATVLDLTMYLPSVSTSTAGLSFNVVGQIYPYTTQKHVSSLSVVLTNVAQGLAPTACIYKFAPIRFSRSQISSGATDEIKTTTCQSDLGLRYTVASTSDIFPAYGQVGSLSANDWNAKATSESYRFEFSGDTNQAHFVLKSYGSNSTSYAACILID
jgi:hypothetical protein